MIVFLLSMAIFYLFYWLIFQYILILLRIDYFDINGRT